MIGTISENDIAECVKVIRESFSTIAVQFGLTPENAPRFTAFSTTEERLRAQFAEEHRPMFAFFDNERIIGYYSLAMLENSECELNNLCVLPEYRHSGIGGELLKDAFRTAEKLNRRKICIGIIEENKVLKEWYSSFGFVHTGTKKFDFFPFTCGYMEKMLNLS